MYDVELLSAPKLPQLERDVVLSTKQTWALSRRFSSVPIDSLFRRPSSHRERGRWSHGLDVHANVFRRLSPGRCLVSVRVAAGILLYAGNLMAKGRRFLK